MKLKTGLSLDQSRTMHVRTTSKNVKEGVRGCKTRCMFVKAVHDSVPTASRVVVGSGYIRMTDTRDPGKRLEYRLDPKTVKAVAAFDKTGKVKPFSTTLRFPSIKPAHWKDQGRRADASRKGVKYHKTNKKRHVPVKNRMEGVIL